MKSTNALSPLIRKFISFLSVRSKHICVKPTTEIPFKFNILNYNLSNKPRAYKQKIKLIYFFYFYLKKKENVSKNYYK